MAVRPEAFTAVTDFMVPHLFHARQPPAATVRSVDSMMGERPGAFPLVVSQAWEEAFTVGVSTVVEATAAGDTGKNLSM